MSRSHSEKLADALLTVVRENVSPAAFAWLEEKELPQISMAAFNAAFAALPRKTGRSVIHLSVEQEKEIQSCRPGLMVRNWTADRLARVWLLLLPDPSDKNRYFSSIETLFRAAEVNELVALYSALPVYAFPEMWTARCAEGIRNNIGDVLDAIMCNNPYPSESLGEPAWNQLVLKAFFTGKPVEQIIGLDERTNESLALTLSDYAHERWAAHRSVDPQIWRCVGKFIDERTFPDILKIFHSGNRLEQEAALLACYDSSYPPAKELLNKDIIHSIRSGETGWNKLAEKTKDHVLQS